MRKESEFDFTLGEWVYVKAVVRFFARDNKRVMIRQALDVYYPARIVGATYRQLGKILNGHWEEPAYLEQEETVLVYQVRRGMTNRIIDVLPGDLMPAPGSILRKFPWRHQKKVFWSADARQDAREYAAEIVRDEKGRFTNTMKVLS